MRNKKLELYIFMLLLVYFLVACKPIEITKGSDANMYDGLINHSACSSPCWAGIQVEKTKFSDAKELLIARYGFDNIESNKNEMLIWKAHKIDGVNEGYVYFSNDVAFEILIVFDNNVNLTVSNLLKILGNPDWVKVNTQPNICYGLDLLYSSVGIYVNLDQSENQKGIQPSQRVFVIRFLQTKITENWNVYDGYLAKWDSYKNYC